MKLELLAQPAVAVLSPNDSLNTAIQQMWRLNIRHLPVLEEGSLIGMVSERDVLLHVCWNEHAGRPMASERTEELSGATRVDQLMTRPVIVLSPEDSVEKAARLMLNKRIGAVPLVSGGTILSIVTETDLLRCIADPESPLDDPDCRDNLVADHMSAHVFTVAPEDATLSAIRLMRSKQVRHIPVVRGKELAGIISDRDVLRGGRRFEGLRPLTVKELRNDHAQLVEGIMSADVVTLTPEATLSVAARNMVRHRIGAIPIIEGEELIGIVTESDLLRVLLAPQPSL